MLWENWNNGKWVFNDIFGLGYPYYHVHPHKQLAVKHLVENLPDAITHAIVFGSSVGNWHTADRDLDICLIGDIEESTQSRLKMKLDGIGYDFLRYNSPSELIGFEEDINSVRYSIVKEGVLVYAKENQFVEKGMG